MNRRRGLAFRGYSDADVILRRSTPVLPEPAPVRYIVKHAGAAHAEHRQGEERTGKRNTTMAWTTPTLVEICIGLEINGYLPAEI